jgi:hypothetical protein
MDNDAKNIDEMDLSYLDEIDVDDFEEMGLLPDPWEGEVEITDITQYGHSLAYKLKPLSVDELVRDITHYVNYPEPDDDRERRSIKLMFAKQFREAFGITDAKDVQSHVGKTGKVSVGVRVPKGKDYEVNFVSKFLG